MVTVAIPVRDGAATLPGVLRAVRAQESDAEVELLICDSGSSDDSMALARGHGARILQISPASFAHGPVRNLLMREARGEFVALLTQDAEPADGRWLSSLLEGFDVADDVALVFGPYRPRPQADELVARELRRWFESLACDGRPRVDRLTEPERTAPGSSLFGRRTFFTDANGCVRRSAWERVPFRPVAYAEDQALALDMLRAGYAKVYAPQAAVLHSHDYRPLEQFQRAFDEWRGLLEVYGWREPLSPRHVLGRLRGELATLRRDLLDAGISPAQRRSTLARATRHHVLRMVGALVGSRAQRLPAPLRRACSLEARASLAAADHAVLLPVSDRARP